MRYTIGQLAESCCLSRSTLLYYSKIGLLEPGSRTAAGYRMYSEGDRAKLEKIVAFRSLGIELRNIKGLLELGELKPLGVLLKRIFEINDSILTLRKQQKALLDVLELDASTKMGRAVARRRLPGVLKEGAKKVDLKRIHAAFERSSPEEHKRLLALLGFSEAEYRKLLKDLAIPT